MNRSRALHLASFLTALLTVLAVSLVALWPAQPATSAAAADPWAAPHVRQNAKDLTANEKARFVAAVKGLKQIPSPHDPSVNAYDYYVIRHLAAYRDHLSGAHMASSFLPWHREFLRLFEADLQSVDPAVTVPYWDWTVDDGPDAYLWADDFLGPEGDPADRWIVKSGPFREGEWALPVIDPKSADQDGTIYALQRHFGVPFPVGEVTLPTAAEVEAALRVPVYDAAPWDRTTDPDQSFRNALEGFRYDTAGQGTNDQLHNRVHDWIGGPMSAGTSPADPVFYLHHANVDRLWAEWMRRHGRLYAPVSGGPAGRNLHDALWSLGGVTPADVLDHQSLGYVYDTELRRTGQGRK